MHSAADHFDVVARLPSTPAVHFKLCFYTAVLRLLTCAVARVGSWDELFARFPFLAHYNNELARSGVGGLDTDEALAHWARALDAWERSAPSAHFPLRALALAAALDRDTIALLVTIGLTEEDPRFGALFDLLQGEMGCKRPTAGLLATWWDDDAAGPGREHLRRLLDVGLVHPLNPDAPRGEWSFQIPATVWDAARGLFHGVPLAGTTYVAQERLPALTDLILDPDITRTLERLVPLVATGECGAVIVRGPHHNGRGTVAGALARALGRGLVTTQAPARTDDERWRSIGTLSTLMHAVPLVRLDPAPGEVVEIGAIGACDAPLIVAIGRHGGVTGPALGRSVSVSLAPPDPPARVRHWASVSTGRPFADAPAMAERFRLTSGGIHRAAELASANAALGGHDVVAIDDVREAIRVMNRQALDTLAAHVGAPTEWAHVAVAAHTRRELDELERRCRQRERLHAAVGPALTSQLTCGVKALLSGPSGTGKTMAARALASSLQMDLYRLNVAAILNKYIGETEKNLNAIFARAEELDVMLLLDEGESWLSSRPSTINSATDKYAAFETNFLLERLESFEGILIITTNGADRIDSAFHRRMDVMIEFTAPEAGERLAIWDVHLPQPHAVSYAALAEVATRCALTGGQIRNAVIHASSLALERGRPVSEADVFAAVNREYRKSGAVCPLAGAYADAF